MFLYYSMQMYLLRLSNPRVIQLIRITVLLVTSPPNGILILRSLDVNRYCSAFSNIISYTSPAITNYLNLIKITSVFSFVLFC